MNIATDITTNIAIEFLIYATLFRLAIIVAGIVSIVLGYRLFLSGVMSDKGTDATMQAGASTKFTVKNAAPGTCFAMFGAAIIVVMLVQGNPELTFKQLPTANASSGQQGATVSGTIRGDGEVGTLEQSEAFDTLVDFGNQLREAGNHPAAIAAYARALTRANTRLARAAKPLSQLAWIFTQDGRIDEALLLARLATGINAQDAGYLAILSQALLKHGDDVQALQVARDAVQMQPENADALVSLALSLEAARELDEALRMMEKAAHNDHRYQQALADLRKRLP
jgi:tetratricopeptide (TPR) repeat protein